MHKLKLKRRSYGHLKITKSTQAKPNNNGDQESKNNNAFRSMRDHLNPPRKHVTIIPHLVSVLTVFRRNEDKNPHVKDVEEICFTFQGANVPINITRMRVFSPWLWRTGLGFTRVMLRAWPLFHFYILHSTFLQFLTWYRNSLQFSLFWSYLYSRLLTLRRIFQSLL